MFAPTALAAANLRQEQVSGAIFVTGNTGIDAVLKTTAELPPPTLHDRGVPRLLVTCHRRENWGQGLRSVAAALRELAEDGAARIEVMLHPNPHVSRTHRAAARQLPRNHVAAALQPADDPRAAMRDCDLMLSDSGGVQEEAPALGVPLLVLREKTERPEALWSGNMRLVGTGTRRIVEAVRVAAWRPGGDGGDGRAVPALWRRPVRPPDCRS